MASVVEAGRAFIRIVLKDQTAGALRRIGARFRNFGTSMKSAQTGIGGLAIGAGAATLAFAKLGVALGGVAVALGVATAGASAMFAAMSVKKAADMVETMNAFDATFMDSADTTKAWAANFARHVGRSRRHTLEALTSFQAFLTGMGLAGPVAAKTSKELLKLATDLSSFRNITDEEGVRRFMSGLAGEPETLRRFGIVIEESAVNLKLMELGFPRVQQGATQLMKVIARMAIIQEALNRQNALGDAVRTAESFVNQVKRLRGNLDEIQIKVGQALLPAFEEFFHRINPELEMFIDKLSMEGVTDDIRQEAVKWIQVFEFVVRSFNKLWDLGINEFQKSFLEGSLSVGESIDSMLDGFERRWIRLFLGMSGLPKHIQKQIENDFVSKMSADRDLENQALRETISRYQELSDQIRAEISKILTDILEGPPGSPTSDPFDPAGSFLPDPGGPAKKIADFLTTQGSAGAFRAGAVGRLGFNLRGEVKEVKGLLKEGNEIARENGRNFAFAANVGGLQ